MNVSLNKMPGYKNKVTAQIGEFLACAALGKQGFIATPFAGNVPVFDVLVADENCRSIPIQVKASNSSSWKAWAIDWMKISYNPKTKAQKYIGKANLINPHLIYIFVSISRSEKSPDRFFVIRKHQLQDVIIQGYSNWMNTKDWKRPKTPESYDHRITATALNGFESNWGIISERING